MAMFRHQRLENIQKCSFWFELAQITKKVNYDITPRQQLNNKHSLFGQQPTSIID